MNKAEQLYFIQELIDNVKRDILKEADKYPESWDGIELRERIADVFGQVVIRRTHTGKRLKEYKNYCLVNGLI